MYNQEREQRSLNAIKTIADAYRKGSIKVTAGNEDFDEKTHTYDIGVIMGIIQNHAYEGLGLPIPKTEMKGVNIHEILESIQ